MAGNKSFINITLLNGTAEGALKCVNKAHDGIIYRIKRDDVNNYTDEAELKQCGIYFLFGIRDGKSTVYIGQANTRKNGNGVLGRVCEHKKPSEDYWTDAFILISSKNAIGATELNYLENQFCNKTIEAGAFSIANVVDPNTGNYSDEVEITMDALIEYTAVVLKVLGYDLFKRNVSADDSAEKQLKSHSSGVELFLTQTGSGEGRGCQITCLASEEGFLLLKNSIVAMIPSEGCPQGTLDKRKEHKTDIDKTGKVLRDISFSSSSALAKFVTLSSVNGKILLKNAEGVTLKELLEQKKI